MFTSFARRLFIAVFGFTVLFFLFHTVNPISPAVLSRNLNSVPWLYSTIGLIFSIISGFIIQHKWHMWDSLARASQNEVSSLRQLYLLSHHFPHPQRVQVHTHICEYLNRLIEEGEVSIDRGIRSTKIEFAIAQLTNTLYTVVEQMPIHSSTILSLLTAIVENREYRLRFSCSSLPSPLKGFLLYITATIIILALFIRIDDLLLDYIFTFSIAMLSYAIYLIIDDLDHPYRPGNWHLTTDEYETLLKEVKENYFSPSESSNSMRLADSIGGNT